MKILFVCDGNTCRSVLASCYARLRRTELSGKAGVKAGEFPPMYFSSAGLAVKKGITQPRIVPELLKEEGVRDFGHKPAQLTAEMAGGADLILVMTAAHKAGVIGLFPEAADKTMTLLEYAGFGAGDIADPYGRDGLFYSAVFKLIKSAVNSALEKLKKEV